MSRPSTSGSLKPRSASYRSHLAPDLKDKQPDASPAKQIKYRYRCISNNGNHREGSDANSVYSEHIKKVERGNGEVGREEKRNENEELGGGEGEKEEGQENYEGNEGEIKKEIENEDDFLRDGLSYVSGLTTTSQRKYILELETLLRQEKLRRIQVEESLQKVIEGKK